MKKAYTLLEILIVVIIIALMIWIFGFFIPDRDQEQIKYGKECSNYIYNTILNKTNNFKKNKSITWQNYIKKININIYSAVPWWEYIGDEEQITHIYSYIKETINNNNIKQTNLISTGGKCLNNITNNNKYNIKLWEKWIIICWEKNKILYLSENESCENIIYEKWEVKISSCNIYWNSNCIPISKIIFNQASQKIEQKFCLDFNWSVCNEWEQ